MVNILDNTHILDTDSGMALPVKYQRIAEIIADYNPELELAWIPPGQRTVFDKEPFAIFHNAPGGRYMIGSFREDQMDHRIIAHLFKIDNHQTNVLSDLEAEENAKKLIALKAQMEEHEARQDFGKALIKTKKHFYRHGGKVYDT
jgi:hypothetical protein